MSACRASASRSPAARAEPEPYRAEPFGLHRIIKAKRRWDRRRHGSFVMLNWAILFLIVALVAAVLGFGGIAGTAIGIAKIIFVVAIILFLISAVMHLMRRA